MPNCTSNGKPYAATATQQQRLPLPAPKPSEQPVGPVPNTADWQAALVNGKGSQGSRVAGLGVQTPTDNPVAKVCNFIGEYMVLPEQSILVTSAWTVAAYLMDCWDRFPHLAIYSPVMRCAKTRLLELLAEVTPNPYMSPNASPAALYRLVERERPTLLLDESQSLARRGSESSEVLRELLNAGISPNSYVLRCGGKDRDKVQKFSVYSPKAVALIGKLDGVLADRCVLVESKRKRKDEKRERLRSRVVHGQGNVIREYITEWCGENKEAIGEYYNTLEPFDIENDRLAELLLPLQAVLCAAGDQQQYELLETYAKVLDGVEDESNGPLLLKACREIFSQQKDPFIATVFLIANLVGRTEEPWHGLNNGNPINDETLANLLRPFGIKPCRKQQKLLGKNHSMRGYYAINFKDAWERYLG